MFEQVGKLFRALHFLYVIDLFGALDSDVQQEMLRSCAGQYFSCLLVHLS